MSHNQNQSSEETIVVPTGTETKTELKEKSCKRQISIREFSQRKQGVEHS